MKIFISRFSKGWDTYFFTQADHRSLGLFRIVFYTVSLFSCFVSPIGSIQRPESIFVKKIPIFEVLQIPVVDGNTLSPFIFALFLLMFFSGIGFLSKISSLLTLFIAIYLGGTLQCYGLIQYEVTTLIHALLIASAGVCFNQMGGFSIDSYLKRGTRVTISYNWPIQICRLFFVYILFSSVLLKMRFGGFNWFKLNVVQLILEQNREHWMNTPVIREILSWTLKHPQLCRVQTFMVLLLEFSIPLALFSSVMRVILVPAIMFFLLSIWAVIGLHFPFYVLPLAISWLPWEKINWSRI